MKKSLLPRSRELASIQSPFPIPYLVRCRWLPDKMKEFYAGTHVLMAMLCIALLSFSGSAFAQTITAPAAPNEDFCVGETITVTVTGTAGGSWSAPGGIFASPAATTTTVTFAAAATATITWTPTLGTETAATIDVDIFAAPTIDLVTPTSPSSCVAADGQIAITASGGSGSLEYSIDGGATWDPGSTFTGLTADVYAIRVRNDNGTCMVSNTDITILPPTLPTITAGPGVAREYCADVTTNSLQQITLSPAVSGDDVYSYTFISGPVGTSIATFETVDAGVAFAGTNRRIRPIDGAPVGVYQIEAKLTQGAVCEVTETLTWTINPNPQPLVALDQTECEMSPLQTLTATAVTAGDTSVVWYDMATAGSVVASPTWNTIGNFTYYAEAVDNTTSCTSTTRTPVTLTLNPAPVITAVDEEECVEDPVQVLQADATSPGATIVWHTDPVLSSITGFPLLGAIGDTTFYAEATDNVTSCVSLTRTPVTLTINPLPPCNIVGADSICPESFNTYEAPAGDYSYFWEIIAPGLPAVINGSNTLDTVVIETAPVLISCAGAFTLRLTITDNVTSCVEVCEIDVTVSDAEEPIVMGLPSSENITVQCDAVPPIPNVTATDNCSVPAIVFNEDITFGICPNTYTITRAWTVTDACGNSVAFTQNINVVDDTPPIPSLAMGALDTTLLWEDTAGLALASSWAPEFGDNCIDTVNIGITVVDDTTFNCGATYDLVRTWTAVDSCGNDTTFTQTISVVDTIAPSFTSVLPTDTLIDCAAPVPAVLTGTDNCDPNPTVTMVADTTMGSCLHDYVVTRTWTIADECGNSDTHVQVITVQDTLAPVFNVALPADTTVDCNSVPLPPVLTGTDDCVGPLTATFTEDTAAVTTLIPVTPCPYNFVLERTWTLTDSCGNTTQHIQMVTVQDTLGPQAIELPGSADTTLACTDANGLVSAMAFTPTFSDNCSPIDSLTFLGLSVVDDSSAIPCFNGYVRTRTWTYEDECSNIGTFVQVITVVDTVGPVLPQGPANLFLACPTDVPPPAQLTATDDCEGAITVTGVDSFSGLGTLASPTVITRKWVFTDGCNSDSIIQTITVKDSIPPVLDIPLSFSQGNDIGLCQATVVNLNPLQASDNCSYLLTHQITDPNSNTTNGTGFIGTQVWTLFGTYTISYTIDDGWNPPLTKTFTVTITDDEDPVPVCQNFSVPLGTNGNVSIENFFDNLPHADNCGINVAGITVSPAILTCANLGQSTVTVTVPDVNGNSASCTSTITLFDNVAPQITCPQNVTVSASAVNCEAVVNGLAPIITDNSDGCTLTTLTYSIFHNTMGVIATGSGDVSGFSFPEGTSTVFYTATDASNNQGSCSFTVTVESNVPPTVTCPPSLTGLNAIDSDPGDCSAVVNNLTPTVFDPCDNAPVLFYEVFNNGNLVTSGNGDVSGFAFPVGMNEIVYTATNNVSLVGTCNFFIEVIDVEFPTMDCPQDITLASNGNCTQTIPVSSILPTNVGDNCGVLPDITYKLTGATVDTGIVATNGTPAIANLSINEGLTTVTYFVTDLGGNVTTCTYTITILDNSNPVVSCPANVVASNDSAACGAIIGAPTFNVIPGLSDACGQVPVLSYTLAGATAGGGNGSVDGLFFNAGVTTVTYTGTDASNNQGTCVFTITVNDTTPPVAVCPPDTSLSNAPGLCGAVVQFPGPQTSDNCIVNVIQTGGLASGSFFSVGTTTIVYEISDDFSNTVSCSFDITISDTEAPELTCPADLTGVNAVPTDTASCDAVVMGLAPIVNDNCDNLIVTDVSWEIFYEGSLVADQSGTGDPSGSTFPKGINTIVYTVTDAAGNDSTCSTTVEVVDEEAPSIACPADIVETVNGPNDCSKIVNFPDATIDDNCPGLLQPILISGIGSGSPFPVGVTTNVYEVTDAAGNTNMCSFTVTVNGLSNVTQAVISNPDPITICEGDTVNLVGNAPGLGETGTWFSSGLGTFSPDVNTPTVSLSGLPATIATPHLVTWTISDGCGSSVASVNVIVNPRPTATIVVTQEPSGFDKTDGILTGFGDTPSFSLEWSNGVTTPQNAGIGVGDYWLIVTDNATQCSSDTTFQTLTFPVALQAKVAAKVFLGGPYNAPSGAGLGTMDSVLRLQPAFPSSTPYDTLYTPVFSMGETIPTLSNVLTNDGPEAIVDWIFLEFRDSTNNDSVLATRSALLRADGCIVDVDGTPYVNMPISSGSFYLAIRHRNHLGIMSADPIAFSNAVPTDTVDFRDGSTPTYTSGAPFVAQQNPIGAPAGVYAMWGGNANRNNPSGYQVLYSGLGNDNGPVSSLVFAAPGNTFGFPTFQVPGYNLEDLNLDGNTIFSGLNNDIFVISSSVFLNPANLFGIVTVPVIEQLP